MPFFALRASRDPARLPAKRTLVDTFGFMRTTVLADCGYCERETDHAVCNDCDETGQVCEHIECTKCGTRFPETDPDVR